MQKRGTIILYGKFGKSGFGFSCMQQATTLNISGKFKYITSDEVQIQVAGSKTDIEQFYLWCMSQKITVSGDLKILSKSIKYNEFEICNHL